MRMVLKKGNPNLEIGRDTKLFPNLTLHGLRESGTVHPIRLYPSSNKTVFLSHPPLHLLVVLLFLAFIVLASLLGSRVRRG